MVKAKKGPGRPSKYTDELAEEICFRLANRESLNSICKDDHMPVDQTVCNWAINDVNGFRDRYTAARDVALDKMADEVIEIADNMTFVEETSESKEGTSVSRREHYQHRRLQFDARRWYLSKLAPKRYGDKLDLVHQGDAAHPIVISSTDAKL